MKSIGQGPPLLCLHSSLSSHKQWLPLAALLSKDYQLLLPDLLGYGGNQAVEYAANPAHSLAIESAALLAQLPSSFRHQPITLIGHSFGGALALHLARSGQLKLKAMVLYEPVAFHLLAVSTRTEARVLAAEVQALAKRMSDRMPVEAAQLFVDYWQQQDYFSQLPARMQQQMAGQVWKVPQDFSALISEAATLADYQQIQCPILLLQGSRSRRSALLIAELLALGWPKARVETLPAGHMGPVTAAALVNARIEEFLRAQIEAN